MHCSVARVAAATVALTLLFAVPASADRAFTVRYSTNDTGQITGIANGLMTCPASTSGCTAARTAAARTTGNTAVDNNSFNMGYIDVDGDASTFDSSSATLALPAGSTILFAGLYWGGDWSTGTAAAPNASARNTVKFKAPGAGAYSTLTATTLDDSTLNVGRYQGFVDVTSRVAAAGNGQYTVADVQAGQGPDHYAGWSLIIAYRNPAEPARNLTIFDGLRTIRPSDGPTDIPVSGFLTPPSGPVRTDVGFVTYEGDNGIVGDSASLNGDVLSDAQHPANNFFDSHLSTDGVNFTAKNPNYENQMGFDVAFTNADGILANSATSTTIRVTTSGDQYLPGVITFATEISAPRITQTKSVTDDNGGNVEPGDTLTYTIAGTNNGLDGTFGYVLRDPIPANTTYVAGSLRVNPTAGTAPATVTDAAGDDLGEHVAPSSQIVARLGTGATATSGGNVMPGASYVVTFRVRVNGPATNPIPPGTTIDNSATATYSTQTTGTPLTTTSTVSSTVRAPDLRLTKTRTGPPPVAGSTTQYTLVVDNVGNASTQGVVTVDDPLSAGVTQTSIVAPGWNCTTSTARRVICTRSDPLPPGASYPSIVVNVQLGSGVTGTLSNTGTVGGGGDGNLENNTSRDTSPSTQLADLSVTKTASVSTVNIGGTIVYTLTATNNGPSDATSVVISDPLPAGLSYVSSTPTCVIHPTSGVIQCVIGSLAAGASATVTITARAQPEAGGTTQTNVATVGGAQNDTNPLNDTDSAEVDVTGADLAVSKTSTTAQPVGNGNLVRYTVSVRNNGPSAASGVVLTDTLPTALTSVTTNRPGACTVTTGANPRVTCNIANLAAGATWAVVITGRASSPSGPLVNRASAVGSQPDPDLTNNETELFLDTAPTADLSIAKAASHAVRSTGDTLTYGLTITNEGPDAATGAVVSDVLPAGLAFVSASSGCSYASVTRTVTCALGTLAVGATVNATITTTVTSATPGMLANTARVSSDVFDDDPSDDEAETVTEITGADEADLAIEKSASDATPQAGDTVVYTLTVTNRGPAEASGVIVSDTLPPGVTFASADAGCTRSAATVTCDAGDLADGESRTFEIAVTVDAAPGGLDPDASHLIYIDKVEQQIDLDPGETRTVSVSCANGGVMTDGSFRVDSVDQATGTLPDVHALENRQTGDGTWRTTLRNDATGRAQAKLFGVCVTPDTHPLVLSAPVTTTQALGAGQHTVDLPCGPGQVAIAPGFEFAGGDARVLRSEDDGTGWTFTVDVPVATTATFSIRCLNTQLGVVDGHTHDLRLSHPQVTAMIPAGQTVEVQVSCDDHSKGIVATSDLAAGLIGLGNDPRPKTRAFKIHNPTNGALAATVDLLCLGDRTGGEVWPRRTIDNTATVGGTSPDGDATNNTATARIVADYD